MPRAVAGIGRHRKLLNGDQFHAVFSQKRSAFGKLFGIHVAGNDLDYPRLGITVSKKVSKKSVERNRIKRQIRESFRLCQDKLTDADYVVISRQGCAEKDNKELRTELDTLWLKASKKCKNC